MKVFYEDNHVLVVYKESGILSQEDNTKDPDLLNMVKDYIKIKYNKPGDVYIGLVHRLDRNTSGIMVFARTSKAASRLSEEIRTHQLCKRYLCVVEGRLTGEKELSNYMIRNENEKKSYITNNKNDKLAVLKYRVLESKIINNKEYTLVDILLKTGRTHQIRCQMAYIGHPLYGDAKYGAKPINRNYYALSSYMLSFHHPTLKDERTFKYFEANNIFKEFYSNNDFLEHYNL